MSTCEDPPDIRLAESVELAISEMDYLQNEIAEIRARMVATIQDASLSDAEIAEIYWRFESVPVSALGVPSTVLRVAREHPYWSWRCGGCGGEVFVTSRSDKKERERGKGFWLCRPCRDAEHSGRDAAWHAAALERERRVDELRAMPYKQYLLTPEWQERRKASLKRAGYHCQVCNRSRVLHVHHRTYERRGNELARDLIVLCDECHALYHGKGLIADERGHLSAN